MRTPTDEAGFLAAIEADPDDLETRLVYADWLEERGDPRGTFLRADCRYRQLLRELETCERTWLQHRYGLDDEWVESAATRYDVVLENSGRSRVSCIKVLCTTTSMGLADAKEVVESAPGVVVGDLTFDDARRIVLDLRSVGARARMSPNGEPLRIGLDVVLDAVGPERLRVIRTVRTTLELPVDEAARLVDSAPTVLVSGMPAVTAEGFVRDLRADGASPRLLESSATPA